MRNAAKNCDGEQCKLLLCSPVLIESVWGKKLTCVFGEKMKPICDNNIGRGRNCLADIIVVAEIVLAEIVPADCRADMI